MLEIFFKNEDKFFIFKSILNLYHDFKKYTLILVE